MGVRLVPPPPLDRLDHGFKSERGPASLRVASFRGAAIWSRSMWIARPILLRLVGALLLAFALAAGPAAMAGYPGGMAAAAAVAIQDADAHPCDGSSASGGEAGLDVGCPTGAGCHVAPALPDGRAPSSQLPSRAAVIVPDRKSVV